MPEVGPRASHGTGRPLLHMHLHRLEAAGLVTGTLEVAEDGKTVKYYDVTPFFHTTETDRTTGRSAKEEAK
ncbi:hypothetical protein E6R61_32355 [Streptomyces sp. LRa12]|nr:hypothetical protein E6R61_32355 [Streptomyces sp. LRa12]